MLALEDMRGMTEGEVKAHISKEYAGSVSGFGYGSPTDEEIAALASELDGFDILVAYESVGSWGCDSSSWFLLRKKGSGSLHTIQGSHCSCFGFEGQGDIEVAELEYLASDRFYFPCGGYDESCGANKSAVVDFIAGLSGGA